jgi:hypothetical protein
MPILGRILGYCLRGSPDATFSQEGIEVDFIILYSWYWFRTIIGLFSFIHRLKNYFNLSTSHNVVTVYAYISLKYFTPIDEFKRTVRI